MNAEKTSKPAVSQHQSTDGAFFAKQADEHFFGNQPQPFFGSGIQAKLSISQPDDPQEKEADAVADQVMRMADPAVDAGRVQKPEASLRQEDAHDAMPSLQPSIMRKCADCEKEDKAHARLMRTSSGPHENESPADDASDLSPETSHILPKAQGHPSAIGQVHRSSRPTPVVDDTFESTLRSSGSGGMPLPGDTRQFMESRFGADFSGVRVHTSGQAESMNRQINAQAFAHGNDIYFNSGKFAPQTAEGGSLLAHELTHTIQQGASKVSPSLQIGRAHV